MVYGLFHIVSAQQTASDWQGASRKTNNFFVSFDSSYRNYWSTGSIEFHFVNVPIKYGQSWVFPVGLKDAVWFSVKNNDAKVIIDKDVETAVQEVGGSLHNKIFLFNDDGSVSEINTKTGLINN